MLDPKPEVGEPPVKMAFDSPSGARRVRHGGSLRSNINLTCWGQRCSILVVALKKPPKHRGGQCSLFLTMQCFSILSDASFVWCFKKTLTSMFSTRFEKTQNLLLSMHITFQKEKFNCPPLPERVGWDAGSSSRSEEEDRRLNELFPWIDVYCNVLLSHHLHLEQWPYQTPTLNGAGIVLWIVPYISTI